MVLVPERRRRLRMKDPGREDDSPPRDLDFRHVQLPRPSRPQVPAVVVGLIGFLAGAILLQSFWGGILGLVAALLIRGLVERLV